MAAQELVSGPISSNVCAWVRSFAVHCTPRSAGICVSIGVLVADLLQVKACWSLLRALHMM